MWRPALFLIIIRISNLLAVSLESGISEINLNLFSDCDGTNMIFESETPGIDAKFIQDDEMTCLNLENRGIIRVSSEAFDQVPNLQNLNLANNRLKKEQFLSLGKHDKLKLLVLDKSIRGGYRNLTRFSGYLKILELNGYFPNLEKLFLRNNSIGIISVASGKSVFPNLTHLFINNNEITNESPQFDRHFDWLPKSLQELHLENNDIDYLGLDNFPNMQWISVDNNRISFITLREMRKLKYFSAKRNEISWISDFSSSPQLEILDLSSNRIRHLNHIHKMPSLRHFILDNNFLHSIPKIEFVPSIESLSVKCNEIRSLSSWDFGSMSSLQELYLDNNRIKFVNKEALGNLRNLRILSLEQNKLTHMLPGWMVHLESLKELNLKGNAFFDLKAMGLSNFKDLTILLERNFKDRATFRRKLTVNLTIDMESESVVRICKKNVSKAIHAFDWVGYS